MTREVTIGIYSPTNAVPVPPIIRAIGTFPADTLTITRKPLRLRCVRYGKRRA